MHYLDSGDRVGSETTHRVLISAEGHWCIVLDQSNGQESPNRSLDGRALKPSFLCRPLYACVDLNPEEVGRASFRVTKLCDTIPELSLLIARDRTRSLLLYKQATRVIASG